MLENFDFYKLGLFILALSLTLAWLTIPILGWHVTVPVNDVLQCSIYALLGGVLLRQAGNRSIPRLVILAAIIVSIVIGKIISARTGLHATVPAPIIPVLTGFAFAVGLGISSIEEGLNFAIIGVPAGVFLGRIPLHLGFFNYAGNVLLNLTVGLGVLLFLTKGSSGRLGFILGFVSLETVSGWDIQTMERTLIPVFEYLALYIVYEVLAVKRLRAPLH